MFALRTVRLSASPAEAFREGRKSKPATRNLIDEWLSSNVESKPDNFERMLQLADDAFASRQDPSQLQIDEAVLEHLRRIHPATVSEHRDANGPVAWLLLIPTTSALMTQFLDNKISERQLFDLTPLDTKYDALYLCSAMVLEEYRRKGIMKELALRDVNAIRRDHPIQSLFVWTFSPEGQLASEFLARVVSLPLYQRRDTGQ